MGATTTAQRPANARVLAEGEGLVNAAGASVGALGAVDLLLGIAAFGAAASYDALLDGAVTADALRAYGLRAAFVGAASLAFVWAVFAEPGARPVWLLLPVGLAVSDLAGDALALSAGAVPRAVLAITLAAHGVLAVAVVATASTAIRRERGRMGREAVAVGRSTDR